MTPLLRRRLRRVKLLLRRVVRWLLLPSVSLLRGIRRLAPIGRLSLPLVRILLAIRIPRRLLAHDALPGAATVPRPPVAGDVQKASAVCTECNLM